MSTALGYGLLAVAIGLNRAGIIRDLPIFDQVRYGQYLGQKFFLVAIAFVFLLGWLWQKRQAIIPIIKQYWRYALILLVLVFAVRIFSYGRWFYIDDFRIITHHFSATDLQSMVCCGDGIPFFPLAMIQLMLRYFGTNFAGYITLTLIFFWLASLVLYAIARKLGAKPILALLISAFFLTSPTYFHETLSVNEFMGEGFTLVLVLISIYLLLEKFSLGSVAFAAAALEFGLSRSHFIALPLALLALWFFDPAAKNRWHRYALIAAFFAISLIYFHQLTFARADSNPITWSHFLILSDMVSGVTLPYAIARPAMAMLAWFAGDAFYISSIVGGLLVIGLIGLSWLAWVRKELLSAKLILLGLFIVVSAILVPSFKGQRVNTKLTTLTSQYQDTYPVRSTSYGLFPTIGMVFIVLGLLQTRRFRGLAPALSVLAVLNGLTLARADYLWANEFYSHQHKANRALQNLVPADGRPKVIVVNDRHLFDKLENFRKIYRPAESIEVLEGRPGVAKVLTRDNDLVTDQLYFFSLSEDEEQLADQSGDLRALVEKRAKSFEAPKALVSSSNLREFKGRKFAGLLHLRPMVEVTPSLVDLNGFELSFNVTAQPTAVEKPDQLIDVAIEFAQHRTGLDFLTQDELEEEIDKPVEATFWNFTHEDVASLAARATNKIEVAWACFDPDEGALPGELARQFQKQRQIIEVETAKLTINCFEPGQLLKNVRILGGGAPSELKVERLTIAPRGL